MAHAEDGTKNVQFTCSDEKKNIFLIGDSICMGYRDTVCKELSDEAEIFFIADNCRNTQHVIINLFSWAHMFDDRNKVDIVQFNCGHWDVAHWYEGALPLTSKEEYKRNIGIIIKMISEFFPNAKIIFATTTTMNPNGNLSLNPRTNAEISDYNEGAKEVSFENNVTVNDLFAVTKDWDTSYYEDYCHFTKNANISLGKIVAENLKSSF